MIGKTISHYKILEKLGEGGMGQVYKAEDTKLKRIVALKFLPHHLVAGKSIKERFFHEARAASALNHPNIITIHDIHEEEDEVFLVMECVDGELLSDKLKDGPLKQQELISIATGIADGLNAAHNAEITHRDIKSENIIITKDGQSKIIDFGLAKQKGMTQITQDGSTLGTQGYMSPEQVQGVEADRRSDIFSFGVVLYQMATGKLPFEGEHEAAVLYSIVNEAPIPVTTHNPNLDEELQRIINKALEKDVKDRYQHADDLLADLRKLKKGSTPKPTTIQRPKWRIPAYIVGVVLIAALFYTTFLKKDTEPSLGKKSIAVLPFSNIKPDNETDYIGFAVADQIIGKLIYLKNIVVRPSSSIRKYEKQVIDPVIAGDDLNVKYILTGNYLKQANIIRLNIELIDVIANEIIWREPIEVDYHNIFELQDIVAQKVVDGMNVKFTQKEISRIEKDIPSNPLAYEYYLRAVSYPFLIEGNRLAMDMLDKSIEIDSNYAPAYNELGRRIHQMETFGYQKPIENKRPENYYLKALSINNELMSALSNLANLYTETNRTEEAVELTKKMLEINPNNAEAHFSLGYIYRYAGMNRESIYEMEKAVALDPKNPRFRSLGISYYSVGEYEKAFDAFEIDKESLYSIWWQGYSLFRQGNYKKANEYFDRVIVIEPDGFWADATKLYMAIMQGNNKEGLSILHESAKSDSEDAELWYYWATEYAAMGDKNSCIKWLQRAVDGGYFNYPSMLTDPSLDSMEDDPEFQKVLEEAKEKHLAFKKRFF